MNNKTAEAVVRECRLFEGMTPEQKRETAEDLKVTVRRYSRNETIIVESEVLNHIYYIMSGRVSGQKFYFEGEVNLLHIMEEGDVIGLVTMGTKSNMSPLSYISISPETLVAVIPVFSIASSRYRDIIDRNIISMLADENIKSMYKVETLSRRGLRDRIMTYLAIMQHKKGHTPVDIGMTQEQLSQYLCVNRSALSYELNNMKKEGLLSYRGRRYEILVNYEEYLK